MPSVRGSMSTKTGVKPHWITEAMSETQVIGGTITSPGPAVSRKAAMLMRFADEPELTRTLCLTPSQRDHSSSKARTCFDWVSIGPPSPSPSANRRTTSCKSSRVMLFFISGQSRSAMAAWPAAECGAGFRFAARLAGAGPP